MVEEVVGTDQTLKLMLHKLLFNANDNVIIQNAVGRVHEIKMQTCFVMKMWFIYKAEM